MAQNKQHQSMREQQYNQPREESFRASTKVIVVIALVWSMVSHLLNIIGILPWILDNSEIHYALNTASFLLPGVAIFLLMNDT